MKWLWCILLVALVAFTGVEGQSDCSYTVCLQLLNRFLESTPQSPEYCALHNQTFNCVSEELGQCGLNNSEVAVAIINTLGSGCDDDQDDQPTTPPSTPPPDVDCTFTQCTDLFHALNPDDTSYCQERAEVYNCLNTTQHLCPNGNILNHDQTKTALDELPSSSCICVQCDELYDALAILSPTDSSYCQLYDEVDACVQRIFDLCSNDDIFWHAFLISGQLRELPSCNVTTPPSSSCREPSCLNGVHSCHPHVELNDGLPDFTDTTSNCVAAKFEENFYYCGMYSYSHLRAFNSNHVHTCSSPGLWALFSHPSLKVTALNSVHMNGPYTVVDELNVVISASNCSQERIYHASAVGGHLPTTFEDGTGGVSGLELIVNSNGTSAYIRVSWINTVIVLHKLGGHIGIAILSPTSVANKSVGLCSLGCPEHSKLMVAPVVNHDPTGNCTQEAYVSCSVNNGALFEGETEGEYYYEKCIFDTLNTNNSNSSWISLAMVNSWHLLLENLPNTTSSSGSTPLPEYENQRSRGTNDASTTNTSSANRSTLCISMVTWCSLLYAITMFYILAS